METKWKIYLERYLRPGYRSVNLKWNFCNDQSVLDATGRSLFYLLQRCRIVLARSKLRDPRDVFEDSQ